MRNFIAGAPISSITEKRVEFRGVSGMEASVAQQQKAMEVLAAQLKEQSAQIQKVSAQLEANKPALRTVVDNR